VTNLLQGQEEVGVQRVQGLGDPARQPFAGARGVLASPSFFAPVGGEIDLATALGKVTNI